MFYLSKYIVILSSIFLTIDAEEQDCKPPFGCFPTTSPWLSSERPVALAPLDSLPDVCLYTSQSQPCLILNETNVNDILIGPQDIQKLIFITHGYMESTSSDYIGIMSESLLNLMEKRRERYVILTVDWATAAFPPYAQAVANIRLIGAILGHFIVHLKRTSIIEMHKVHLIGHSLGSHLMGYAGYYVNEKIGEKVGRITALDPAGPYFRESPPVVRLDPSDADFVDVIHSDSEDILPGVLFSLGNPERLGHFDFYPNGGNEQPGCPETLSEEVTYQENNLAKGIIRYLGCHHQRSLDYFILSISDKKCPQTSVQCDSWESYKSGKCWSCKDDFCSSMGYFSERDFNNSKHEGDQQISLFYSVDSWTHTCGTQIRITLISSNSSESLTHGGDVAKFRLTARGKDGQSETFQLPPTNFKASTIYVTQGSSFSWVYSSFEIENIKHLLFEFETPNNLVNFFFWRFSKPKVYIKEIIIEELSKNKRIISKMTPEILIEGDVRLLLPD